ncbi:MAG TPA: hypothetical protein VLM90_04095, partial [Candidatus Deferrimicrobium sp.]|nr:hypothetical protein [Candidatus Deferrimicrobium sp.]
VANGDGSDNKKINPRIISAVLRVIDAISSSLLNLESNKQQSTYQRISPVEAVALCKFDINPLNDSQE